ncbi:hypothetical protein [Alkalibacillus silvisoli]|uniref:Diacylglyceryl transferase n=1 Tax=Alkalibacillus silvisoli TaxID=392823 RepID=A0ABN0ZXB1_9BACI
MNDLIQIGPLNIFVPYLFYIAGIIASAVIAHLLIKRLINFPIRKKPADLVIEYWVVFIAVWKISYFINYPMDILNNPLAIIYFDGGTIGMILGFSALLLYSFYQKQKHEVSFNVQLILMLQSLFVFIIFERASLFLYGFDLYIFLEVVSYSLLIVVLVWKTPKPTWFNVFKAFRWFLITWALFRVITDEIHLYTGPLMLALFIALITFIFEWYIVAKQKGDTK